MPLWLVECRARDARESRRRKHHPWLLDSSGVVEDDLILLVEIVGVPFDRHEVTRGALVRSNARRLIRVGRVREHAREDGDSDRDEEEERSQAFHELILRSQGLACRA